MVKQVDKKLLFFLYTWSFDTLGSLSPSTSTIEFLLIPYDTSLSAHSSALRINRSHVWITTETPAVALWIELTVSEGMPLIVCVLHWPLPKNKIKHMIKTTSKYVRKSARAQMVWVFIVGFFFDNRKNWGVFLSCFVSLSTLFLQINTAHENDHADIGQARQKQWFLLLDCFRYLAKEAWEFTKRLEVEKARSCLLRWTVRFVFGNEIKKKILRMRNTCPDAPKELFRIRRACVEWFDLEPVPTFIRNRP